MKKPHTMKIILITLLLIAGGSAALAAVKISLDTPARLPIDI